MTLQFNLFDDQRHEEVMLAKLPEGFHYQEAFIDQTEQNQLLALISELPFREFEFLGYTGKRRVASFGWRYDYSGRRLQKAPDIPEFLLPLRVRAASFAKLEPELLQQALVTEYSIGAGIGWHRDKAVFGQVVGISLLSECVLRFRRKVGAKWERVNVTAAPRSAYVLSGTVRSEWEHSIPGVEELRYSITFRNVLN
jgi:alkylated DNA repair dioxygenase AlkB